MQRRARNHQAPVSPAHAALPRRSVSPARTRAQRASSQFTIEIHQLQLLRNPHKQRRTRSARKANLPLQCAASPRNTAEPRLVGARRLVKTRVCPRHAVVVDEAGIAEIVAVIGVVIIVVIVMMIAIGLLGAGPVKPLVRARLLFAIHQRKRCRRLVRAADDGQKLQQALGRFGLRP